MIAALLSYSHFIPLMHGLFSNGVWQLLPRTQTLGSRVSFNHGDSTFITAVSEPHYHSLLRFLCLRLGFEFSTPLQLLMSTHTSPSHLYATLNIIRSYRRLQLYKL